MTFLLYAGPVMGGVGTTFYLAENLLHEIYFGQGLFLHGNYCANKPFSLTDHGALISLRVGILIGMVSLLLELFCQFAIFVKRTKIELKAEVIEIRGQVIVSRMRHQRNVVNVLGHLLTFILQLGQHVSMAIGVILITDGSLFEKIQCSFFFLVPCIYFVVYPLIETLSSDNLRESLFSFPKI